MTRLVFTFAAVLLTFTSARAEDECTSARACLDAAHTALVALDVGGATSLAERATALAPKERAAWELVAALADDRSDLATARRAYDALKKLPAKRSPPTPAPPARTFAPGSAAFVEASRLRVRTRPEPKAKEALALSLNAPVVVEEMKGEWAKVKVELVSPTRGARVEPPRLVGGFVLAAYLSPKKTTSADVRARVTEAEKKGDAQEVARQLERALLLSPGDLALRSRAVRAALDAGLARHAVQIATRNVEGRAGEIAPPVPPQTPAVTVTYHAPTPVLREVKTGDEEYPDVSTFTAIGDVVGPKGSELVGYALVRVFRDYGGPCKSSPPSHALFLLKGTKAVALAFSPLDAHSSELEQLGVKVNGTATIGELEVPTELRGARPDQTLTLFDQRLGGDPKGKVVFSDPLLGDVRLEESKQAFFVRRKDGTLLWYQHTPPIRPETWTFADGGAQKDDYDLSRLNDYYSPELDVAGPIGREQLVRVGAAAAGQALWGLPPGPLLDTELAGWKYNLLEEVSREALIKHHALVFIEDAFGRFIRAKNKSFINPFLAEPIIYLYPTQPTPVQVRVSGVSLAVTCPETTSSWHVVADPDGTLHDPNTGATHTRLFWEGFSERYPLRSDGWSVARVDVEPFLRERLFALGLRGREIEEFLDAWLPSFVDAPWYFITFVDPAHIDALAPLHVDPAPDSVIRVLMEYAPRQTPLDVVAPTLPDPPVRTGFTVVEWGGVRRTR